MSSVQPLQFSRPESFHTRFWAYAFRPLFLLLALQAIAMMAFWGLWSSGYVAVSWQRNAVYWHGHEMLSGFAAAAIGGFALTAVANWTSRPPVQGLRLMLLCALWLGGRLSLFAPLAHAFFDIGYWLLLWALMANEVLRAGNRRNYKILVVLALMLGVDAAWHVTELTASPLLRQFTLAQLWLVILLICVVGGRIIPAFTSNWLRRQAMATKSPASAEPLPVAFNRLDLASLVALVVFALSTLLAVPAWFGLLSGLIAAGLHGVRLSRWQGLRTLSDPLVWMLHLSFAWIPIGIALLAFASMGWLPFSAGVHALTVGCVASMVVSVSSRAALGHTNRTLHSHPLLTSTIVLLNVAALLRIGAALGLPAVLLAISALVWIVAFVCYAVVYVPILLGPRQA